MTNILIFRIKKDGFFTIKQHYQKDIE